MEQGNVCDHCPSVSWKDLLYDKSQANVALSNIGDTADT